MSDIKFIHISKLDAARRELEHAIKLFFNYGDVVIVHLVSCSAEAILSGIGSKQGIVSLKLRLKNDRKKEKQREVTGKINEA